MTGESETGTSPRKTSPVRPSMAMTSSEVRTRPSRLLKINDLIKKF